ncbi:hypothetical protein U1Q18_007578 [Sarracenia purpurea var. burkii]
MSLKHGDDDDERCSGSPFGNTNGQVLNNWIIRDNGGIAKGMSSYDGDSLGFFVGLADGCCALI